LQRNTANNQTTHLLAMSANNKNGAFKQIISAFEATLSKVAGLPVGIAIRGEKNFTYYFDGENKAAYDSILKYFDGIGTIHELSGYEAEFDVTSIFHDL